MDNKLAASTTEGTAAVIPLVTELSSTVVDGPGGWEAEAVAVFVEENSKLVAQVLNIILVNSFLG